MKNVTHRPLFYFRLLGLCCLSLACVTSVVSASTQSNSFTTSGFPGGDFTVSGTQDFPDDGSGGIPVSLDQQPLVATQENNTLKYFYSPTNDTLSIIPGLTPGYLPFGRGNTFDDACNDTTVYVYDSFSSLVTSDYIGGDTSYTFTSVSALFDSHGKSLITSEFYLVIGQCGAKIPILSDSSGVNIANTFATHQAQLTSLGNSNWAYTSYSYPNSGYLYFWDQHGNYLGATTSVQLSSSYLNPTELFNSSDYPTASMVADCSSSYCAGTAFQSVLYSNYPQTYAFLPVSASSPGVSSSTPLYTQDAGDLSFGLSIIITLLSVAFVVFIANSFRSKRHII